MSLVQCAEHTKRTQQLWHCHFKGVQWLQRQTTFQWALSQKIRLPCAWPSPVSPHHLTHLDQTLPAVEGVTEALQQGTAAFLLHQLEEKRKINDNGFLFKVGAVDETVVLIYWFLGKAEWNIPHRTLALKRDSVKKWPCGCVLLELLDTLLHCRSPTTRGTTVLVRIR